jgi:hypothetical protein
VFPEHLGQQALISAGAGLIKLLIEIAEIVLADKFWFEDFDSIEADFLIR